MIQNNKLLMIVLFTSVLSVGSVSILLNTVKAQEGQSFSATLSGKDEVPPTESNSTGTAKFQVNENNSQVSYWVNITGIKKVNQAHIHNGTSGENGDIVATLSKGKSAKGDDRPPQIGFAGKITKDDLQGPLKGKEISDLVTLMSDGGAYANVHTDKYPKGAIRGQIASTSGSTEAGTSTNATTASTDTGASANATTASTDTGASTDATSTPSSPESNTDANATGDGQQESASSQSTDSPNMDIDESMK
ncbi:MAG: CHRD domain-containing protein [Nitrososphaeraceae archaeon]